MSNHLELLYNDKYLSTPHYPRQKRKLKKQVNELKARGVEPTLTAIRIEGDDHLKVIDNVRSQIGDVAGRRLGLFFGDGGNILVNYSISENLGGSELEDELWIADGGTMANLAHALGTADPSAFADVVSKRRPSVVENLRLRNAEFTIFDGEGNEIMRVDYPWTCSVGTDISGTIIRSWEDHPRTRNPVFNLVLSTWQVIKDTVKNHGNGQPILGHSVTTLNHIGFFEFDKKYTDIEGDVFHHQSFESEFGLDALKRIAVFLVMGHSPTVSRWAWSRDKNSSNGDFGSDLLKIASEVEPRPVTELTLTTDGSSTSAHLDGYPIKMDKMGLEKDGSAQIKLSSSDKSIPVRRVKN